MFAVFAIALVSIGLTSFLVYSVRLRAREIAIRVSLGATPADLSREIAIKALLTVSIGLVIGAGLGASVGRILQSRLFLVQPIDLSTIVAVAAFLATVALVAAWLPARIASRTEPAKILRHD